MTGVTLALVALLGGVGAATRFVVDGLVRDRVAQGLPIATAVVNVTGSLVIGLLAGAQLYHAVAGPWLTAAMTGFCGGYTTFSTAMVETVRLLQAGELRRAALTALGSVVLTVAAAALGVGVMAYAA
ncbi:CrcB family protein [Isoptericola sp. b441]|uniref:Fluoride-specific ion channel FluC n=1 Tax=Actinotalea lenta TaxID=3064654 RepID=A0ABT9DAT2_9CELL|nr:MULTISPECIES: CrcB family protein [unclassified Isoptericola]MDO8107258.1 CrcB family protein [Isoptericola sp. b441]MDO8121079.1 CrcB family protein [Isoptericola sp. b490]